MRILLARHAEAVGEGDWVPTDEVRYLSLAGRTYALEAGRALAASGERPDLVLTSPLVRAVQTAELMARSFSYGGPIETRTALEPGGSLGAFLDAASVLPPEASVLAVGHEPQMSGWSAMLLGQSSPPRPYRPGVVLVLEFEGLPEPGAARAVLHYGREGLERL